MHKVIKLMAGLLLLVAASSCTKHLDNRAFVAHMKDPGNGACKKVTLDKWHYTFQYLSPAYLQMLDKDDNGKAIETKRHDGYVTMSIAFNNSSASNSPLRQDINNYEEYQARLNYYIGEAAKDISISYGGNPLQVANYHFETNYNLTPQETMVFNFKLPSEDLPGQDIQVSYYDRVFKNGIIKVLFKGSDLKRLNEIIINSK